ncbi:metallophosphoesterase [Agrobacterium sp.]|uniref:metallophosphoesterase family protein n=1 Tax=Agrobacterium sp. TaxID=361 RepID=UPI0028A71F70|nr:metallophosphoesterase [Agrobacterium sp.]
MTKIAVVADVHLHDLYGGYGMVEEGSGELALRTLADTTASTRVFNESYPAFLAVLDDIVRRGIRDVVLLGDYSDDGQPGAVTALKAILSSYEEQHGLRFFATFGNHDCFGPVPHQQAKRLTRADGRAPLLVASEDYQKPADMVLSGMLGMKTLDAMHAMAPYGIACPSNVLHWETPFGNPDALSDRRPDANDIACLDGSYLVEPQQGLWLLMLDANVFQNTGDTWTLKADAAWDHFLAQRPYFLSWIEDVARRAKKLGKTLLAFSHYPNLPLALREGANAIEVACTPEWAKRMPSFETARLLTDAGIHLHFSGHMHVSGRVQLENLLNIAVPSPVAYPGGYVVVCANAQNVDIETVQIADVPGFDVAFAAYRLQSVADGADELFSSENYADFLLAHLKNLIKVRHVPHDWSSTFRAQFDRSISDVLIGENGISELADQWQPVMTMPLWQMVEDYYLFRSGGEFALVDIPAQRVGFYRDLIDWLKSKPDDATESDLDKFLDLFVATCTPHVSGFDLGALIPEAARA